MKIQKSFWKYLGRVLLAVCIIFVIAVAGAYTWFVHNSKRLLIDVVYERSSGKLKLDLTNVNFNFITNEVNINMAKISSTNNENAANIYQVTFRKITLHTNSIWSLLFTRSLEIKQIKAYDPVIEVYNRRKLSPADSISTLSIGKELGKIYKSIEDGFSVLHTHSIYVVNATLILNNNTIADKKPIVFSNIYFTLKKLHKFDKLSVNYLENNNVEFSSSNQAITFSDGIHQLQFKKLSIQHARNIVLDSCTIIGLPVSSPGSNYNIHFKRLALVGVDFNALYSNNIIKADSVYCENPVSTIQLFSKITDSNVTAKRIPDLEKIIKVFSGNLDLGFVGVMNADIHLDITGKKSLSNIHSGKVNFQIKNLRINPDSSTLVSMSSFDMMVKGYQLYNSDSTCIYSFDSVRFANDKLLLNNVSIHTTSGKHKIRNYRDYTMPYFELLGIDWSELVFRQNLKATEAILYNPTINFIKNKNLVVIKKSLLFNSSHSFDDFMEIDKVKIVDGSVNVNWGENNSLQLSGVNIGLSGDNITDYKHVRLNEDIELLFFTKGLLKIGNINAQLLNVSFKANNRLYADELLIDDKKGGISSKIENVSINNIYSEKSNGNIVIDGLKWSGGNVALTAATASVTRHKPPSILLKNVSGNQTHFEISKSGLQASAFLNEFQLTSFLKNKEGPPDVKGLHIQGSGLNLFNNQLHIKVAGFSCADLSSEIRGGVFENGDKQDSVKMVVPYAKFTADVNDFLLHKFYFQDILLRAPVINLQKLNNAAAVKKDRKPVEISVKHLKFDEPVINLRLIDSPTITFFSLPFSQSSFITINNLQESTTGLQAGNLHVKTSRADITKGTKQVLQIDKDFDMDMENIEVPQNSPQSNWSAFLNQLVLHNTTPFNFDVKQKNVSLQDISLGNFLVKAGSLKDIAGLIKSSPFFWIKSHSANYRTKKFDLTANGIKYEAMKEELVIDSFNYRPLLSRDSTIALSASQIDYIDFTSGRSVFTGIEASRIIVGSPILLSQASLMHPSIKIYRDKLPPFKEGVRKKLLSEQLKEIKIPISIEECSINDGSVTYTERNDKSRLEGSLKLTQLNGDISNVKTHNYLPADSLSLALTGRLLDEGIFDISIRESYVDPLYGFRMKFNMRPVKLNFLNPLLGPLSNINFVAGRMDNLRMTVVGNENAAHGNMKFYYHDLHIQLLKNGGVSQAKLFKGAESGLVNFFFVKNNNTSRTGPIYFERVKDRSFFNYIDKIILTGVGSSIGPPKSRKYVRLSRQGGLADFE